MKYKVTRRIKLTEDKTEIIRKNCKDYTIKELAKMTGLKYEQVSAFLSRNKIKDFKRERRTYKYGLTQKERELLPYLILPKKEIAKHFFNAYSTISTNINNIIHKIFQGEGGTKEQALFKALKDGIITLDEVKMQ